MYPMERPDLSLLARFATLSLAGLLASLAMAQQDPAGATPAPTPATPPAVAPAQPAKPHFVVRHYPQDSGAAIAVVGNRTLTLGDLVDHIDAVHQPGFRDALAKHPTIQAMLQSDVAPGWVRHFADLEALRQANPDVDATKLKEMQSEALRAAFQRHLDGYVEQRRAAGRPEVTQQTINGLLSAFQLEQGLACEVQGFLDYLEPRDYNRVQLQNFFNDNARAFGGTVKIAHILIQNRDAGTGILLDAEGLARANARLADVRARLRPDGSNFEDVALNYSDDQRTAREGGVFSGIKRFDERLPTMLCRAAWFLRDGEVSDVIESQYGWHIVKRIEFDQRVHMLFTDDVLPAIKQAMQRARQEDRLIAARKQATIKLLL